MKLISACLLGINCRYSGKPLERKLIKKMLKLIKGVTLIPVCPEQLGGLSTPREPAEIRVVRGRKKVFTKSGKDVTENFVKGAQEALKIAKIFEINEVILKSKSPSCGVGEIHDGTFTGRTIKGDGIFAALLKKHGIKRIRAIT